MALCALALGACSMGEDDSANNGAAVQSDFVPGSQVHTMPWSDGLQATSAPSGAHLSYNGGPMISNVKVVQVLWGAGTYSEEIAGPQFGAFYQAITNSTQ